ncbi:LOW QUALITY PROTEIN: small ribosomal subunit protein uS10m [Lolium perenne]|uniref:LOW QUALITY PROTEIN: small ribosomal subunit protein uS10m n=1 Tax=Lolium perenne TaxID=4522 RepID=UPI003A9A4E04
MLRHAAHRLASRAAAGSISRRALATEVGKPIEETKEDVYPKRMQSESLPAKIRIVMKSFNSQKDNLSGLEPYMRKVGLPESRSLYTVLRSPHIDKKSREQFSMHVKKCFVEKKAETHELAKKFFWLKRLRILGAQYEINISFKTRLDKKIGCRKSVGLLRQYFQAKKGGRLEKEGGWVIELSPGSE